MIDLTRSLRHLAWADGKFFTELAALDVRALDVGTKDGGQRVGELARHIVEGAEWYRYCLNGTPWTQVQVPTSRDDLLALGAYIVELDRELLAEALVPDQPVTFNDEHGERTAMRSTILTQASYHATEHRAQLALALDLAGIPGIDLDEYDLWAFEQHEHDAAST